MRLAVRKLLKAVHVNCEFSPIEVLKNRSTLSKDSHAVHGKSWGDLEHWLNLHKAAWWWPFRTPLLVSEDVDPILPTYSPRSNPII